MPYVRISMIMGRSANQIRRIADANHRALVAFGTRRAQMLGAAGGQRVKEDPSCRI